MKHSGTVTLETERLVLRRFNIDDAENMYKNWASEEETTRFLIWQPHSDVGITKDIITSWVNRYGSDDYYNWVIELRSLGEPIGSITVVKHDERISSAILGYCMGTKWWGQEIMPEAGRAVIKYLFETVGFNRIAACHDVNNPKSGRVMQKIGMTYEGTLRSAGVNNRGIIDEVWYSILREEYDASKRG